MKYCEHCGHELLDEAVFCPHCGCQCGKIKGGNSSYDIVVIINKVLLILTCISAGVLLIPLLWMVPMTVKYFNAKRDNLELSTGFKICSILFLNMICGILMFVEDEIAKN